MKHAVVLYGMLLLISLCFSHCKKDKAQEPEKDKKAIVTTIAGTGEGGFLDGPALSAKFFRPTDIAVLPDGAIYVTDMYNSRIRKISTNGQVAVFAGSGTYGIVNGNATTAQFRYPSIIALDAAGNAYVLDEYNYQVRKISPAGDVSLYAGTGLSGFLDGPVVMAKFDRSWGIHVDAQGNVLVADTYNNRIRKISTNGQVSTVAGTGVAGYADGNAAVAQFKSPYGITMDKQGNIYVADYDNYRIRKITPDGLVSTLAGSGIRGYADGNGGVAQFDNLWDMVVDSRGNIYVLDMNRIRKITPAGEVSTLAGSSQYGFADGEGTLAQFDGPSGLAIDAAGNIYVADKYNNRIRKISFE